MNRITNQRDLEGLSHSDGYRMLTDGSDVAANPFLRDAVTPTYQAMLKELDAMARKRGVKHVAFTAILKAGADVSAYITSRIVTRALHERARVTQTCQTIGSLISEQVAEATGAPSGLGSKQQALVGIWCLDQFCSGTGLASDQSKKVSMGGQPRTEVVLVPTTQGRNWLTSFDTEPMWHLPPALPMVELPLPWGPTESGGYRYALRGRYPLVRGSSPERLSEISASHMPDVYATLNALQETPWRINASIADILESLAAHPEAVTGEGAGLLRDATTDRMLVHTMRQFRHAPTIFFVHNLDFRGRVYPVVDVKLSPQGNDIAKSLLTFAIGRALGLEGRRYLAQHGASCLGSLDGVRASQLTITERVAWMEGLTPMICHAAADPLRHRWWTRASAPWQFLAFCFEWARLQEYTRGGGDSESFVSALPCRQDGSCNTFQHAAALLQDVADARRVNLLPSERPSDLYALIADKLILRLQLDGQGDMRSTVRKIQTLPSPPRKATRKATGQKAARRGRPPVTQVLKLSRSRAAQLWLTSGLIDRAFVKEPTVIFAYGRRSQSTATSIRESLEELAGESKWGTVEALRGHFRIDEWPSDVLYHACLYIADVLVHILEQELQATVRFRKYAQAAAKLCVSVRGRIAWRVPSTGFQVAQDYRAATTVIAEGRLNGRQFKPEITTGFADTPDKGKHMRAIGANVMHSLDAAALVGAVVRARQGGVQCLTTIHDSFGAPAGDCATLARATREGFEALYSGGNVLDSLDQQWREQTPGTETLAQIPDPPPRGGLNVSEVLSAPYFFA